MKLFNKIFNKSKEEEFEYYTIVYWQKPNEKLLDIANKYKVKVKDIMKINKIKEEKPIYQPRRLEIRVPSNMEKQYQQIEEDYDEQLKQENNIIHISKNNQNAQKENKFEFKQFTEVKVQDPYKRNQDMTLEDLEKKLIKTEKFSVFYQTKFGEVLGLLTVSKTVIMFDPDINYFNDINDIDKQYNKKQKKLDITDFQCRFDINDIYLVDVHDHQSHLYLDLLIECLQNQKFPLIDKHGNQIVIKCSFKQDKSNPLSNINYIIQKIQFIICKVKVEKPKNWISISSAQFYEEIIISQKFESNPFEQFEQLKQDEIMAKKLQEKLDKGEDFTSIDFNAFSNDQKFFNTDKNENNFEDEQNNSEQILPEIKYKSRILDENKFAQIVRKLPVHLRLQNWELVYSPNKHGYSYEQFLLRSSNIGPHLIVIEDMQDTVFGAFLTEGWKILTPPSFIGTGETFLFTFRDFTSNYQKNNEENKENYKKPTNSNKITAFYWDGKDTNFQYCDETGIAIGVGSRYGIYIHESLMKGFSTDTDTFKSKQLSKNSDFEIYAMEVYGINPLFNYQKILNM